VVQVVQQQQVAAAAVMPAVQKALRTLWRWLLHH